MSASLTRSQTRGGPWMSGPLHRMYRCAAGRTDRSQSRTGHILWPAPFGQLALTAPSPLEKATHWHFPQTPAIHSYPMIQHSFTRRGKLRRPGGHVNRAERHKVTHLFPDRFSTSRQTIALPFSRHLSDNFIAHGNLLAPFSISFRGYLGCRVDPHFTAQT